MLGSKTSTPFTLTCMLPVLGVEDVDVRLAEDHEQVPLPVFFRSSAMCRSAFIRALSTGMRPSLWNSLAWAS